MHVVDFHLPIECRLLTATSRFVCTCHLPSQLAACQAQLASKPAAVGKDTLPLYRAGRITVAAKPPIRLPRRSSGYTCHGPAKRKLLRRNQRNAGEMRHRVCVAVSASSLLPLRDARDAAVYNATILANYLRIVDFCSKLGYSPFAIRPMKKVDVFTSSIHQSSDQCHCLEHKSYDTNFTGECRVCV